MRRRGLTGRRLRRERARVAKLPTVVSVVGRRLDHYLVTRA